MRMLMGLEWDAIIIGAVVAYGVGWIWFDKLFRDVCHTEGCIKPKNMKLAFAVDFVSTVLLAALVAVVLSAFGGAYALDMAWLWSVIFVVLVVGSGVLAGSLWWGRSMPFIGVLLGSYVVMVVIMALAYVYVERFI